MNLFYAPDISSGLYTLNYEESKHCVRVLRLSENEMIQLVDGKGGLYEARIVNTKPLCVLQVENYLPEYEKRSFYLHIAMSPLKNADRFEWFIEKAVELGVDEITPIICERTERRSINIERLERIAVSAMKQSEKAYKPIINNSFSLKEILVKSFSGTKLIAHCNKSNKFDLPEVYKAETNVAILIGPEGDFMENEISDAAQNGYLSVSLGKSRLRSETAAVKACAVLNFLNKL
jgi:16S rRNA (uracil1498-N3)-methyltransferase